MLVMAIVKRRAAIAKRVAVLLRYSGEVRVGLVMGLWLFSAAMLVSHMAFAPTRWLRWLRVPPDSCEAAAQNGWSGAPGSSASSAATDGQRAPGSIESPRANAR